MPLVKRSPKNPLLWPNRENAWEAEAAFNGCAVQDRSVLHLLYRAESSPQRVGNDELHVSTIGHAVSRGGGRFASRAQLIRPEYEWERYGCEDPRVTKLGGNYYVFYTALSAYPFGPDGIKVGLAITKDFKTLDKHPVTPFNAKAMALFPGKVNGKFAAILTVNTDRPPSRIALAFFGKEEEIWSKGYWDRWYGDLDSHVLELTRSPNDHVEVGAPPVLTEDGWLLLYSYIRNYFSGNRIFGIEAVLLDRKDPSKILSRTERPILVPEEEYEQYGRVPNIVFPTGAVVKGDTLHIYYGAADTTTCLATCSLTELLEEMRASTMKLERFEGNPIIAPIAEHGWESKSTCNPAAVQLEGRVHLLYRAMSGDDASTLGYASLKDGLRIEERLPGPVYVPREAFEKPVRPGVGSGCEDPRLTPIGDDIYMCYTAYDGTQPRIALTSIRKKDFLARRWNWTRPTLISPPDVDDKDAAIFPKRFRGKYAVLHRLGKGIWLDFVDDLRFEGKRWLGGRVLMRPRPGLWDSGKIGISGPPIETKKGWLLLYHGISKRDDRHYHVRAALLDLKDPSKVLARTKYPIFEPETPYERQGLVPNVVFPCGSALIDGALHVYYGGGDRVVGVASIKLADLLDRILKEPKG